MSEKPVEYDLDKDEALGFPRRIELIVYGYDDYELSHMKYDGTLNRCREMQAALSKLFQRWNSENAQVKFCGQCGQALSIIGDMYSCMTLKCPMSLKSVRTTEGLDQRE